MSVFDFDPNLIEPLKDFLQTLEDSNYYSILYTYHSNAQDNWLKAARVVDKKQKIKHMIAIRPYAISPEYFVMMYRSFEQICKNRIMFNIVPGRILEDERVIENSLYISDLIDTTEKRIDYADKWLEKVLSIEKIPEIAISGIANKSLELAKKYGDYSVFTMDLYNNDRDRTSMNIKKMCLVNFLIRETYEEAEYEMRNVAQNVKNRTFYGTKQTILEQVKELEDSGITDIMIRVRQEDNEVYRIHEFVKENSI